MDEIVAQLPYMLGGLWVTLYVTFGAWFVMMIFGLLMAALRTYGRGPLRWLGVGCVELLRGTSTLVLLFWAYYVLPQFNVFVPQIWVGVIVLGLVEGAYASEAIRGALLSVPRGQLEAATMIGLRGYRRLSRVVLPQAIPTMIAPIGNLTISLLKFTSLLSFIGISDLVSRAQQVRYTAGHSLLIFAGLLVVYFLMSTAIGRATLLLERRFAIVGRGQASSPRARHLTMQSAVIGS